MITGALLAAKATGIYVMSHTDFLIKNHHVLDSILAFSFKIYFITKELEYDSQPVLHLIKIVNIVQI
jgi:hypothetical protein